VDDSLFLIPFLIFWDNSKQEIKETDKKSTNRQNIQHHFLGKAGIF